jgi:nucleotide-binding universal stress UspA family protein
MMPTLYGADDRETSLKQGEELVQKAEEPLIKAGYQVHTSVKEGNPKITIVEDASKWKADLIILGSHGRTGLDRILMGSVSEAVARYAPCSVEIVRMPTPVVDGDSFGADEYSYDDGE